MIMKRLVDGGSTGGAWASTQTSRAFNIVHRGSQWGFTLDVWRVIFSNYHGWRLNFRAFDGWRLLTRKSVQEIKKYWFLYKIILTWCLGGCLGLSLLHFEIFSDIRSASCVFKKWKCVLEKMGTEFSSLAILSQEPLGRLKGLCSQGTKSVKISWNSEIWDTLINTFWRLTVGTSKRFEG